MCVCFADNVIILIIYFLPAAEVNTEEITVLIDERGCTLIDEEVFM